LIVRIDGLELGELLIQPIALLGRAQELVRHHDIRVLLGVQHRLHVVGVSKRVLAYRLEIRGKSTVISNADQIAPMAMALAYNSNDTVEERADVVVELASNGSFWSAYRSATVVVVVVVAGRCWWC
jgi:hypothetical protein